jgi:WD40 repeat protein
MLEGHSKLVNSIVFSPDSKLLLLASDDKTVKIWEIANGSFQQTFKGHSSSVNLIIFSPNSKLLISASNNKIIKIWDIATGFFQQIFENHNNIIISIVFLSDSKLLILILYNKIIKIWEIANNFLQQTFKGYNSTVTSVVFSRGLKLLALASYDKIVKIWDAANSSLQQTIIIDTYISRLSFDITETIVITNIGRIKIDKTRHSTLSKSSQEGGSKSYRQGLGISGPWVTWDTQNLLWLPPNYRPMHSDISLSGSTVAIGCRSGKVFIIGFSL